MILIKDRHWTSTLNLHKIAFLGKYDTYKGSTLDSGLTQVKYVSGGKYDTYKGSTLKLLASLYSCCAMGNMILIKDRNSTEEASYY